MSEIKISLLSDFKSRLTRLSKEQRLLALTAASVFMPFIITCIMLIFTAAYSLCTSNIRRGMFSPKSNIPIYILSLLLIAVPLFYKRYFSLLAGFGFLLALIFFLFARYVINKSLFELCMDVCCLASVVPFIFSIAQKFIIGTSFRTTGGMLNANYYGTICEFIIIIAMYRILTNKPYKNLYIAVMAMNVAGVFLCDCQSAWIAAMAGVVSILFFNSDKKQGYIFLAICMVLVIIGLFIPGVLPRMELMPQTFKTRLNIWGTAFEGIKAHPLFGQGTLTYLFIYKLYGGYKTYHAHSLYLDPLLSYGIIGAGLMISYIIILLKKLIQNIINRNNKQIMTLTLAIIFAVCIHGITDITILWVQTGMLLFLILSGVFCKSDDFLEKSKNKC